MKLLVILFAAIFVPSLKAKTLEPFIHLRSANFSDLEADLSKDDTPEETKRLIRYYLNVTKYNKIEKTEDCFTESGSDDMNLINQNCAFISVIQANWNLTDSDAVRALKKLKVLLKDNQENLQVSRKIEEIEFRSKKNIMPKVSLQVTDGRIQITSPLTGRATFSIDTGAEYSTISKNNCQGGQKISLETPLKHYSHALLERTLDSKMRPLLIVCITTNNTRENILGRQYLSNFDKITFINTKNPKKKIKSIPLYYDSGFMFIQQDFTYNSTKRLVNICIDTGSTLTFYTQKLFKATMPSPSDVGERKLSSFSSLGYKTSAYSADIKNTTLNIGEEKYRGIPVIFYFAPSPICDVILGRDILYRKNFSIDLKKKHISL